MIDLTLGQQKRLFHFVTSLITTIAFLSYFAMATGDGIGLQTISVREDSSHSIIEITKRQIYWVRYIDVSLNPGRGIEWLLLTCGLVDSDDAAAALRPGPPRRSERL